MQPKIKTSYADSVRAWGAAYKDSVLVDMHYDNETGFKNIYVEKADKTNYERLKSSNYNEFTHNLQYYMVPLFFAIVATLLIFGLLVMTDSKVGEATKGKDKLLDLIKRKNEKNGQL